ncbi:MAG: DUF1329 domain-containing protein [Syntrophobacteraceae bacterium]
MKKRALCRVLSITVFFVFALADWSLAGSDWKEEQAKMFSQISVKPGDTINASSWEKIKDLLPAAQVEWVKNGDLILKIGELKYDYDADSEWKEATAQNAGKYDLDATGEVVEKASGKSPDYVYGEPFPNIDWKNDQQSGVKVMHNYLLQRSRVGSLRVNDYTVNWINRTGKDREICADYYLFYYWGRPDGMQPNPEGYLRLEIHTLKSPDDVSGAVRLDNRFRDARPDDFYFYVPIVRRVKKLAGVRRSDPYMGSDFIQDDGNGWDGKNSSMTWKVLEKKIILSPVADKMSAQPMVAAKEPNGSWAVQVIPGQSMDSNWEVSGSKGAPWCPANAIWVPRWVYVIEAMPKDPYYSYGRQIFYIDPSTGPVFKTIFDKAGQYWKTLALAYMIVDWGDTVKHRTCNTINWYGMVDDRANHGCTSAWVGTHAGKECKNWFNDPTVTPGMFDATAIGAKEK